MTRHMQLPLAHAGPPSHRLVAALVVQSGDGGEGSNPFLDAFQWIGQILLWPIVIVVAIGLVWFVLSRLRRRP